MKCLMEFRKSRKFSKVDMAKTLGISQSLYEKVEYNDRGPSRMFMSKFKSAFPDFDMNIFFEELLHESCSKIKTTV